MSELSNTEKPTASPRRLNRRVIAVLKAALLGAAIAEMMILLCYLPPFGNSVIPWLLAIPAVLAQETVLSNPYIINGLIGAIVFGVVAAIWQFGFK